MRTIRRIYFYAVALISVELVIWGVVGLLRNIFNLQPGASPDVLASGLALLLVGLPIFLLHWAAAQREAARDDEEKASRVRALFLYGVRLGVLIPIVQSSLAIINRIFLDGLGSLPLAALVGGDQSTVDNLIAIGANLVALFYFQRILQKDWRDLAPGNDLAGVRRLYRYVWVLYTLILLVMGTILVMQFVFYRLAGSTLADADLLGNGLALMVVGAPLWAYTWRTVQLSLDDPVERSSLLRLGFLFLLTLAGAVTTLTLTGPVLAGLIRQGLGEGVSAARLLTDLTGELSGILPFGVIWGYFGRRLDDELNRLADTGRRDGLRRLYNGILSMLGTLTVFFGTRALLGQAAQALIGQSSTRLLLIEIISNALAALIIGLPLWLIHWRRLQAEAAGMNESGDHARRSLVRRSYLYLALFLTVVGTMVSGGWLLYQVFNNLLGTPAGNFARTAVDWLQTLLLVLVWLFYHLRVLRSDTRLAARWLGERHARFPLLVLQGEGESFTIELVQALQRNAPRLPIAVHRVEQGAPAESMLTAAAVVLPAVLSIQPGEALRAWLAEYQGRKLVVPLAVPGWTWLSTPERDERELAIQTAQAVRQLAEGQEPRVSSPANPWMVTGSILGGIFGLILLLLLVTLVISAFS